MKKAIFTRIRRRADGINNILITLNSEPVTCAYSFYIANQFISFGPTAGGDSVKNLSSRFAAVVACYRRTTFFFPISTNYFAD